MIPIVSPERKKRKKALWTATLLLLIGVPGAVFLSQTPTVYRQLAHERNMPEEDRVAERFEHRNRDSKSRNLISRYKVCRHNHHPRKCLSETIPDIYNKYKICRLRDNPDKCLAVLPTMIPQPSSSPIEPTFYQPSDPSTEPTSPPANPPTNPPAPTSTLPPTGNPNTIGETYIAVSLCLHALGQCGNSLGSYLGNMNPLHPTKNVTLTVSPAGTPNGASDTFTGAITYDTSSQTFKGNVSVGRKTSGNYDIRIHVPVYLDVNLSSISLTTNQANNLPIIQMMTGDMNLDNQLNDADFNTLMACYSDLEQSKSCNPQQKLNSDLNDDGAVNSVDYNIYIRELTDYKKSTGV